MLTLFSNIHPEFSETPLPVLPTNLMAEWLYFGVYDDVISGMGAAAYGTASEFIFRGDDRPHDLFLLFQSLTPNNQIRFRAACKKAIERLNFGSSSDLQIADILLRLAQNIGVSTLIDDLAKKAVDLPSGNWPLEIYMLVLDISRKFAPFDGEHAELVIRHLVSSNKRFPPLQSGLTLVALVAARPSGFSDHWNFLENSLETKYGFHGEKGEGRRQELRDELLVQLIRHLPDKRPLFLQQPTSRGIRLTAPRWWIETLGRSKNQEILHLRDASFSWPCSEPITTSSSNVVQGVPQPDRYDEDQAMPTTDVVSSRLGFEVDGLQEETYLEDALAA